MSKPPPPLDFLHVWQETLRQFSGAPPDELPMLARSLEALSMGHVVLPTDPTALSTSLFSRRPDGVALRGFSEAERLIAAEWHRLSQQEPRACTPPSPHPHLSSEQQEAISRALHHSAFLLEGGPGTGKTFTAASLLHHLHEQGHRWLALAPTGKAKAQLQASLQRAGLSSHYVTTVQAALRRRSLECPHLPVDAILVDESSMLDLTLFLELLQSVPPGARLLLMGDRFQLQPVGPGQPFYDLCQAYQGSSQHIRLSHSQRVEEPALLGLASAIQEASSAVLDWLLSPSMPTVHQIIQEVHRFHTRSLPHDPDTLMLCLKERMVLNALQEGPYGTEALQESLQEALPDPTHPWKPTPLLIMSNAERLELWNGDLCWCCNSPGEEPFALAPRRASDGFAFSETTRKIPLRLLPRWCPAWMLTIHKAQGSEFDHVKAILPPGSERFGRPLLYTAVTRARKSVSLRSSLEVLTAMLTQSGERRTTLPHWLSGTA